MSAEDPVRLPARSGGYTTARHRAVVGTDGEVSEAVLDEFAADAREQEQQRHQELTGPIIAAVDDAVAAMGNLEVLLAGVRKQGVVTRVMRRRLRRIGHDLAELHDEICIHRRQ